MLKMKNWIPALLLLLVQQLAVAQNNGTWDWRDSSKVALKNLPQHNEFMNNENPYPVKPRNQWELGLGVGPSFILGDVNAGFGYTGSVSARKALGHVFSIRGSLAGAWNRGTPSAYGLTQDQAQYKSQSYLLGFDLIASLNTASYYRGDPKSNLYVLVGYSLIGHRALYKDPAGQQSGGYSVFYGQRPGMENTNNGLITTMFGSTVNNRKSYAILHGVNIGLGYAYKISDKINLGIEQKFVVTAPGYDYLDAWKGGNNSNDFFSFTTLRLNINIGNRDRKVQPLYWVNPNNYLYGEINSPRHMKLPKVSLPDGDRDGVTDQFDMEPNTPAGAPVDSHGVSKDTDGDGIPDYKDKELLTPQKCFPVNPEGIGNCPEPPCCKEMRDLIAAGALGAGNNKPSCTIGALPSVQFKGTTKLNKDAQTILAAVAARLKANPNCNIKVIGYGTTSKSAQQQSWDRVNVVIKYLVEKQGIAESRLLFVYAQDGDANVVDLEGTTDQGPYAVPAPHPNLKSNN
ncbi:MAG: hypothetical protein EAZ62_02315 [Sphingobacteriia bacterium]|nr:MAG: hypothetical protein EAZ62_02315 [Sphingobacteriia bacterium]